MTFRLFPTGENSYKKGFEVFNSYGRRANENLLSEYGFAMIDNEWDEVDEAFDIILLLLFVSSGVVCSSIASFQSGMLLLMVPSHIGSAQCEVPQQQRGGANRQAQDDRTYGRQEGRLIQNKYQPSIFTI